MADNGAKVMHAILVDDVRDVAQRIILGSEKGKNPVYVAFICEATVTNFLKNKETVLQVKRMDRLEELLNEAGLPKGSFELRDTPGEKPDRSYGKSLFYDPKP